MAINHLLTGIILQVPLKTAYKVLSSFMGIPATPPQKLPPPQENMAINHLQPYYSHTTHPMILMGMVASWSGVRGVPRAWGIPWRNPCNISGGFFPQVGPLPATSEVITAHIGVKPSNGLLQWLITSSAARGGAGSFKKVIYI